MGAPAASRSTASRGPSGCSWTSSRSASSACSAGSSSSRRVSSPSCSSASTSRRAMPSPTTPSRSPRSPKTRDGTGAAATETPPPAAVALWAVALLAPFLLRLGAAPLFDVDEGAFAEATREMLASGDFGFTTLHGAPRFDKPILVYWLQAASVAVFGLDEASLRLPSALCGWAWCLVVARFAWTRLGPRAALLAGTVAATSLGVLAIGRAATADALLNLLLALAGLDAWRHLESRAAGPLRRVYLWIGLGLLAKGPVALVVPAGATLAWALASGALRRWARAARPGRLGDPARRRGALVRVRASPPRRRLRRGIPRPPQRRALHLGARGSPRQPRLLRRRDAAPRVPLHAARPGARAARARALRGPALALPPRLGRVRPRLLLAQRDEAPSLRALRGAAAVPAPRAPGGGGGTRRAAPRRRRDRALARDRRRAAVARPDRRSTGRRPALPRAHPRRAGPPCRAARPRRARGRGGLARRGPALPGLRAQCRRGRARCRARPRRRGDAVDRRARAGAGEAGRARRPRPDGARGAVGRPHAELRRLPRAADAARRAARDRKSVV